jgi:hypothetical protein
MVKSSLGGNLTSGLAPCLRREARLNECTRRTFQTARDCDLEYRTCDPCVCAPLGLEFAVDVATDKFAETPACERSAT